MIFHSVVVVVVVVWLASFHMSVHVHDLVGVSLDVVLSFPKRLFAVLLSLSYRVLTVS